MEMRRSMPMQVVQFCVGGAGGLVISCSHFPEQTTFELAFAISELFMTKSEAENALVATRPIEVNNIVSGKAS